MSAFSQPAGDTYCIWKLASQFSLCAPPGGDPRASWPSCKGAIKIQPGSGVKQRVIERVSVWLRFAGIPQPISFTHKGAGEVEGWEGTLKTPLKKTTNSKLIQAVGNICYQRGQVIFCVACSHYQLAKTDIYIFFSFFNECAKNWLWTEFSLTHGLCQQQWVLTSKWLTNWRAVKHLP